MKKNIFAIYFQGKQVRVITTLSFVYVLCAYIRSVKIRYVVSGKNRHGENKLPLFYEQRRI